MKNNTLIRLTITRIASPRPGARGWQYDNARETFPDLPAALEWLEETYGIRKPARIRESQSVYVDGPDGSPVRVGFLSRRWEPSDENPRKKLWCEDWISLETVSRPQPFALA